MVLASRPGEIVTNDELLLEVRGSLDFERTYIAGYIGKIREKIEEDPQSPVHLITCRGKGYILCPPEDYVSN